MENDNKDIDNYEIDEIEPKILLMKTLKDFNDCVDNHNLSPYDKEQQLLNIVFEYNNIINKC